MTNQADISDLEEANKNKADFILCVPADMVANKIENIRSQFIILGKQGLIPFLFNAEL